MSGPEDTLPLPVAPGPRDGEDTIRETPSAIRAEALGLVGDEDGPRAAPLGRPVEAGRVVLDGAQHGRGRGEDAGGLRGRDALRF